MAWTMSKWRVIIFATMLGLFLFIYVLLRSKRVTNDNYKVIINVLLYFIFTILLAVTSY